MGGNDRDDAARTAAVLGRTRETTLIEAFLGARDRLPRALAVDGEPGIGKTTVWRWAVDAAQGLGYATLEASPARPEMQLVFAALGDLLGEVFPQLSPRLPAPQRHALAAALLVGDEVSAPPDQRTIGVAVLSVLRLLSAVQPVLIAVDDEQWLDSATATALAFGLRRLRNEPVALLTTRRADGNRPDDSLVGESRLPSEQMSLGPLSLGALHACMFESLGTVLSPPRLRRIHELSRGNPFLALELVRALAAGRPGADDTEIEGVNLERLLGARLDSLPPDTRSALLVVAAAPHPTVDLLTRLGGADARSSLEPAVVAGIVEATHGELRFTHPLLASAAYAAAGADERRAAHNRLAGLATDPEERARHAALAAIGPDEGVAADVERAAAVTFARGAPANAAELAALSVRLTPPDATNAIRARSAVHADYLFEAGETEAAAVILERLIADSPAGPTRALMLTRLARVRHFGDDVAAGVELDRQALNEAGDDNRLRAGIHEGLAWGLFLMRSDLAEAARHARQAVEEAERAGDDVALAEGLAAQALTAQAIGAPDEEAMRRALALEPRMLELRVLRHPSYAHAYVLACTDRLAEAAEVLSRLLQRAEERGDESAVPPILLQLSMAEILAGHWAAADAHARTGFELALQGGQRPSQAALLGRSALLAAYRGRLDDAESLAEKALALAGGEEDPEVAAARAPTRGGEAALWALGVAALASSRYDDACSYLSPLADLLLGTGMREPGELRFLPDTVQALTGARRLDEADDLAARIEDMADRTGRQTALGVAARSRAGVEARRGNLERALSAAERSIGLLDSGDLPLERARARLVLGELQRRSNQKRLARETLALAAAEFNDLGAMAWAARAMSEASRIGGRAGSTGALTPTETRVAALVVDGLANKEIAHELGIATKTVELHLSHIYAKLAVGSRTELVRRMSTPPATASGEQTLGNSPVQ